MWIIRCYPHRTPNVDNKMLSVVFVSARLTTLHTVTLLASPEGRIRFTKRSESKVWCSTLLDFVVLSQSYYDFSPSVSFFQIPDSLRHLTQPVALVDDRFYRPGLHEIVHDG